MLNIGMTELLVFGIIALLVLGPEKLPEAARFAGKWYGKLKRLISNVQDDIDRELRMAELREQMQTEMQRIQALEQKMQAHMQQIQQQSIEINSQHSETSQVSQPNLAPMYQYITYPPSLCQTSSILQPSQAIPRKNVRSSVQVQHQPMQEAV